MKKIIIMIHAVFLASTLFAANEMEIDSASINTVSLTHWVSPLVYSQNQQKRQYSKDHHNLRLPMERLKQLFDTMLIKSPAAAADLFQALYEKNPDKALNLMDNGFSHEAQHAMLMALPENFLGEFLQRMTIDGKDRVEDINKWAFTNKKDGVTRADFPLGHYMRFVQYYIWFILGWDAEGKKDVYEFTGNDDGARLNKVVKILNHFLSTLEVKRHLEEVMRLDVPAEMQDDINLLREAIKTNDDFKKAVDAYLAAIDKAHPNTRYSVPVGLCTTGAFAKAIGQCSTGRTIDNSTNERAKNYLRLAMGLEKEPESNTALREAINANAEIKEKVNEFLKSYAKVKDEKTGEEYLPYRDIPEALLAFEPLRKKLIALRNDELLKFMLPKTIEYKFPGKYTAGILNKFSKGADNNAFILDVLTALKADDAYLNEVLSHVPCNYLMQIQAYVDEELLNKIFDLCYEKNADIFLSGGNIEADNEYLNSGPKQVTAGRDEL